MLKPGVLAPDIDATTTTGDRFVLSAQKSICTVVYFFPRAFTPGCTRETKTFAANHAELELAGASIVGVSTDDDDRQCEFARELAVPFPLISDADKRIGKAYGVLYPLIGIAKRVTFVIGAQRSVAAVFHDGLDTAPHRDGVLPFVHRYCEAVRAKSRELWNAQLEVGQAKTVPEPKDG